MVGCAPWRRRPSIAPLGATTHEPRRLTAQGLERKQQLLDSAARAVRRARLRRDPRPRHRPPRRRRQGPLLLVLREQGSAVPRAGRSTTARRSARRRPTPWTRPPSRCCASARAPRRRSRPCRPTPTSSPCSRSRTSSGSSPTCCAGATRSTWPTPSRLVQAGIADGTDPRRGPDPARLRRGRRGRLLRPLPPHRRASTCRSPSWPPFVGRYVVRSLAADEEIARGPACSRA